MPDDQNAFKRQAAEKPKGSLAELFGFIFRNKKWWLTPIVVVLLLVGILVVLGGTGVAPFIYTLF
jgi:hypothetical protein